MKKNEKLSIWHETTTVGNSVVFGNKVRSGTVVNRIEKAEVHNKIYGFTAIFIWKLYLNLSSENESNATKLIQKMHAKNRHEKENGKNTFDLSSDAPELLEEYFECIIAAYIFSYSAIEAYVNELLSDFNPTQEDYNNCEFLTKSVVPQNSKTIVIIKKDLEKESNLEEKLFGILPYYLQKKQVSVKFLNDYKANFKLLQFVRNELIHVKRRTSRTGLNKTSKLWNTLVPVLEKNKRRLQLKPSSVAKLIIENFEELLKMSRSIGVTKSNK